MRTVSREAEKYRLHSVDVQYKWSDSITEALNGQRIILLSIKSK
jgi:hypothetical protein